MCQIGDEMGFSFADAISTINIASRESYLCPAENLSPCSFVANAKNSDVVVLSQLKYTQR